MYHHPSFFILRYFKIKKKAIESQLQWQASFTLIWFLQILSYFLGQRILCYPGLFVLSSRTSRLFTLRFSEWWTKRKSTEKYLECIVKPFSNFVVLWFCMTRIPKQLVSATPFATFVLFYHGIIRCDILSWHYW